MDSTDTVEAFKIIAAKVFARCYAEFPIRQKFNLEDFTDKGRGSRDEDTFTGTMEWLVLHKWISTAGQQSCGPYYSGVQLTEKALVALGWTPGPLRFIRRPSIGERLVAAAGKGALEAAAGKLVLEALKMAM